MTERPIRVRFAPSPTGPLHMGGVRTALFNYLFAQQHGGTFLLRIEDTDSTRFVPGAEAYIIEALRWCGIHPHEGVLEDGTIARKPSPQHPHAPYRQSERKSLYRAYAEQLVSQGDAYYAFDSAAQLEALRKDAEAAGQTFTYNYQVRNELENSLHLPEEEVKRRLETQNNWVIRYKIPQDRVVHMHDLIRGHIQVHTSTLDDKVLWKAQDQLPTYHLANIVDDHLMEISHVIRGEEWLPSLPLHYLLYESLGWKDSQPQFAHLSLLLKPDGKGKLSKRDGDRLGFPVFPLQWTAPGGEVSRGYREDGYYAPAFVNLIALLGWNPGTEQEIFSLDQLVEAFSLERVVKAGARFNPDKAKWFNQQYLRMRTNAQLAQEFQPILQSHGIEATPEKVEQIVALIKERANFVHEFWDLSCFFFIAPTTFDPVQKKKYWKEETPGIIDTVAATLEQLHSFTLEEIDQTLHQLIATQEWKMGPVMNALRLCLVGAPKGPGIAQIMDVLGQKATVERLRNALSLMRPVGIASDHAGYELKELLKAHLTAKGIDFKDFGTHSSQSMDYPDVGHPLARAIEDGTCPCGIALCGTGNGMAMTLNKHPQLRAALCWSTEIARLARGHNNANVLVLPARFITPATAQEIVDAFFATAFEGDRHQRRIDKIPLCP